MAFNKITTILSAVLMVAISAILTALALDLVSIDPLLVASIASAVFALYSISLSKKLLLQESPAEHDSTTPPDHRP